MLGRWLQRRTISRDLETLTKAHVGAGTFAGAVLVQIGDDAPWRKAYSVADVVTGRPNTPDTAFRIGSTAKVLTAATILRLGDLGALSIDDALSRYLPTFPGASEIRLRHLLSNTSGLADFLMLRAVQPNIHRAHAIDEVIAYFRDLPRLFPPGERLAYSNAGWVLLAAVIESVTRSPYARAVTRYVLDALSMRSTYFDDGTTSHENVAQGHSLVDGRLRVTRSMHATLEIGAGGFSSVVDDLRRLDMALRAPGFLKPDTLASMKTVSGRDGGTGYGYGLMLTRRHGDDVIGHPGGTFGFTSFWSRYIEAGVSVIVLANVDNGSADALERNLALAAMGRPYEMPAEHTFVSLPHEVLDRYVGRYRSSFAGRDIDFSIERKGDELVAVFPLLPRAPLRPLAEARFFVRLKGADVTLDFDIDPTDGRPRHIEVDWGGMPMRWPNLAK